MSLYKQSLFNIWQTITSGANSNTLDSSLCPEYSSTDISGLIENNLIFSAVKNPFVPANDDIPYDPINQQTEIEITGNDVINWKIMHREPIKSISRDARKRSTKREITNIRNPTFNIGNIPYLYKANMQYENEDNDIYRSNVSPNISSVQILVNGENAYINHVELYTHRTISVADYSRVYYQTLNIRRPSLAIFTKSIRQALISEGTELVNDTFTIYVKYEWGVFKSEDQVVTIEQSSDNSNFDINGVPIGAKIDDASAPLYNSLTNPLNDLKIPKLINPDIQILSRNGDSLGFKSIFNNADKIGSIVMKIFLDLAQTSFDIEPFIDIHKFSPYQLYRTDIINPKINFEISTSTTGLAIIDPGDGSNTPL